MPQVMGHSVTRNPSKRFPCTGKSFTFKLKKKTTPEIALNTQTDLYRRPTLTIAQSSILSEAVHTHLFVCETQVLYEEVKALNTISLLHSKTKGDLVHGVNFNWIWESSAPPGHALHLTWLKLLWCIKYHIPCQTLHRSQASWRLTFES